MFCVFVFFKQKTAYEMRISDWSSDVCSSDLRPLANFPEQRINRREGPLVTRTKVAIGVPETAIIIGPALREILLVESGRDQDERVGVGKRPPFVAIAIRVRSEEHTSELQSLMRISYAVFCLKKKKNIQQ